MDDPTRFLTPPTATEAAVSKGFASPLAVFDYWSPSAWLFEIIKDVTGVDVLGHIVSPLVGHWNHVSAYGDALKKLAQSLQGVSANVSNIEFTLDGRWDGNAADAASVYFSSVATSLRLHSEALEKAHAEYQGLAVGMWHLTEVAEHLVKELLNKALEMAIYAAAGTVTAETGVGAAVGYGLAAYKALELLHILEQASKLIVRATMLIEGTGATLVSFSKQIKDLGPIAVVQAPYQHPAIG
jgi:hypothetical protein